MKVLIILVLAAVAFATPTGKDPTKDSGEKVDKSDKPLTFKEINDIAKMSKENLKVFIEALTQHEKDIDTMNPDEAPKFAEVLGKILKSFGDFEEIADGMGEIVDRAMERAEEHGLNAKKPCGAAFAKVEKEMPESKNELDLAMFKEAVKLDVLCIAGIVTELMKPIGFLRTVDEKIADQLNIVGSVEKIKFLYKHIHGASKDLHNALKTAEKIVKEAKKEAKAEKNAP